jgi:hypothetical protein
MTKETEKTTTTSLLEARRLFQEKVKDPARDKVVDVKPKQGRAYQFKYADLEAILTGQRPLLSECDLVLDQVTKIDGSMIVLISTLSHVPTNESMVSEYPVGSTGLGHQQLSAALTYSRRLSASTILGITTTDDNDMKDDVDITTSPKVKMNANQAKDEINWEAIQNSIDKAETLARLNTISTRVKANEDIWPGSYVSSAYERIAAQRIAVADKMLSEITDVDKLNDTFQDIEASLQGLVDWDTLSAIFRKQEQRILG